MAHPCSIHSGCFSIVNSKSHLWEVQKTPEKGLVYSVIKQQLKEWGCSESSHRYMVKLLSDSLLYGYNYLPFFEIPPLSFSIHFVVLNLMTSEQPHSGKKYNRVYRTIMHWVSLCSVTVFSTVLFFYKVRQADIITITLQTKWQYIKFGTSNHYRIFNLCNF